MYYQYKGDRARRTVRGIDQQVAKAEKAVAGRVPVKRNRFIQLTPPETHERWSRWRRRRQAVARKSHYARRI